MLCLLQIRRNVLFGNPAFSFKKNSLQTPTITISIQPLLQEIRTIIIASVTMNSQFTFIQQIYRIIANGNAQDLALFNATLDDFFHQSRAFTGSNFSGNDDLHYFYSLYPKILDRLFGGNCTGYQDDEIHFQTNTKWAKGDEHGWLKQLISLHSVTNYSSANSLNSSNNNNNANGSYLGSNLRSALRNVNNSTSTSSYLTSSSKNNNNHMSIQQIKQHFLHFFHPFHKLFHLLERTNYELHISLLPEKTQQLLHHHPLSQYLLWNENSSLFLSLLLHLPYHEVKRQTFLQRGRHAHQEIKTSISLDPLEYFLVFLLRYPILSNQLFSEPGSTAAGGFLSGNSSRKISSLDLLNDPRKGLQYWVNAVPYLFLLQVYLDELFPVNHRQHQTDLQRTTSLNTNNQLMPLQSMQSTRSFSTHDQEQYVNKYRQLFLQLIISYWIDQLIVIRKDHHLLTYYRKLARANTSSGLADVTSFSDFQDQQYQNNSNRPHPSPLELTVLDPVCKWTIPTCQSLYLFLFHLQRRNHDLNQELQVNAMKTLESGHAPVHDFSSLSSFTIWRQLQMPVYDMLSYIFDHGDESSIDREVVFTAIEIWLLWVQPWEHVTSSSTKKDGFTSPNPSTAQGRSHIEQHWHYYIHANYHFYSTLFNFFMRMISKCNISLIDHLTSRSSSSSSLSSSSSFYSSTTNYSSGYSSFASTNRFGTRDLQNNLYHEGNRLLYMLEKVIRVFNAPFCEYLEGIGKEYVEWYEHYYLSEEGLYSPGNHHVNLRKLFRTRNNPTSSLHASESNTSLNTVASNDSLLAMILLRDHHYDLFPDRKIDYIENIGISRVREDSKLFTITIFQNLQNQIDLLKVKKRGPFPELQAYLTLFTSFLFEDSESESNAKIAKRLERVQNQLIDVFNYVNLQLYVHQPGSGSLSSPSEDSFASGLSAKSSVRNKFTGKLTIKGKELAHQRVLQCDAKELNAQLVYSRDPLDLPICSFELFPSWTKLLIRWSKELNTRYDIPKTGAYIHSSWHDIYVIYHQEHSRESARRSVSMQGRSNDLINSVRDFIQETLLFQPKIYWIMVQQCFRFNLRFLGTYETLVLANVLLEFLLLIDGYSLFSLLLPIFAIAFLTYTYLFL